MAQGAIKTFEDVLKKLGTTEDKILPDVSCYPKQYQKSLTAFHKLVLITNTLNSGWQPNWDDENELKYTPYFNMGCGFFVLLCRLSEYDFACGFVPVFFLRKTGKILCNSVFRTLEGLFRNR